ncbi:MAG: AI-2E family transporter [Alkalilacustris sp.]
MDTSRLALDPPAPRPPTEAREALRRWRGRAVWWLALALVLGAFLWLLGPMLTPFAVGAAIGYFLDPLVSRLQRRGIPRAVAAASLVALMMAFLIGTLVLVLPILASEATTFLRALPDLYEDAQRTLAWQISGLERSEIGEALEQFAARAREALTDASVSVFGGVLAGLNGVFRAVLFWVVMPVVAFYLLMDWQRILREVDDLMPRANVHTVRGLARDIDAALAGYVRGVAVVCTILAVYYGVALTLAGLPYGVLVGVIAGAISFIPYVGAFVGGALAIGLALWQFWDAPASILLVVAIFSVGQIVESQILVPRLVGTSINLHPLWVIFAVMAFGFLFGLAGAIVAVPLAAALGVLVRFAVAEYRSSSIYTGQMDLPAD